MEIAEVACFYVQNGNYIEIMPYAGATRSAIELYLNGSVYGAILHQRKTMPLHGSCFQYRQQGIMICGESGVGKSSLTTSFCLNGATFLTDDVTPVLFSNGKPYIWGVSDRIKLWSDSLLQLNQPADDLERIVPEQGKYYFPMRSAQGTVVALDHIFVLHTHHEADLYAEPVEGVARFTALRNEIYRREFLAGMMESETAYLQQLITISKTVKVTNVYRPADCLIEHLRIYLQKLLLGAVSTKEVVL